MGLSPGARLGAYEIVALAGAGGMGEVYRARDTRLGASTRARRRICCHAGTVTIAAPEDASFGGPLAGGTGSATQVAVSPDGRNIVFVAGSPTAYRLWLRPLAAASATPIPGTDGGSFPFWSPDSRFIAFFADGKLKKVQVTGGPPVVVCDAPAGRGGSWNRDNVIVFTPASNGSGIARVSGAGGTPRPLTTLDPTTGEKSHRWPRFLPDGRRFLYTAVVGTCCPAAKPAMVRIARLDSSNGDVPIMQAESAVLYAARHLLFARDETLMAQPFDLEAGRLAGDPFPIAERVSAEGSRYVGASISDGGTLVYGEGGSLGPLQLTWVDRAGRVLGRVGETDPFITLANVTLSPDERRVAFALSHGGVDNRDAWIIDMARGVRSRQTFDRGVTGAPIWAPDGSRIAFGSARAGAVALLQKPINTTAAEEPLLSGSTTPDRVTQSLIPSDWSRDGRFIAYTDRRPPTPPISGCFPCSAIASRTRWSRRRSPKRARRFRRTGVGSRTRQRSAASRTCSSRHFRAAASAYRFRATAAAIRCGARMEGSCSTWPRMGR